MYTRRKFLVATAGAGTVALAGCSGDSGDENGGNGNQTDPGNIEFGEIQYDAAALRDNGTTVTLPVTNPGSASEIEVTMTFLDGNESEIASYSEAMEIGEGETVDYEFDVDAAPNLASIDTEAVAASSGNGADNSSEG